MSPPIFFCRSFLASLLLLVFGLSSSNRAGEPTAAQLDFFEGKVRPLLKKHCFECHSSESETAKGGLMLDSKEAWQSGGDSGEVIEPGSPNASLLIESVRYKNPNLQMPPKYQLSEKEIEILEGWVEMGAPDPRKGTIKKSSGIDWEKGKSHWAYQPITSPNVPTTQDTTWAKKDLDRFVLSKLENANIKPVADADRFALIRRVSLDLTGLPPTVTEVGDFIRDPTSDDEALAKVVDRLLNSPAFGERWGRHWLDVARYADSVGKTRNIPFPYAWRYRNYVIDSFNADKPYNEFLSEQIAGDLLKPKNESDREENLIATGFLALGSMDLNERDTEQFQLDRIDDQIDTIGRATMGMTLACARCHDHKFDPVPQKDYYAIAGIFASTETMSGQQNRRGGSKEYFQPDKLVSLRDNSTPASSSKLEINKSDNSEKLARLRQQLEKIRNQGKVKLKNLGKKEQKELKEEYDRIRKQIAQLENSTSTSTNSKKDGGQYGSLDPNAGLAMAAVEGSVGDMKLRVRGEPDIKGDLVPRGFPVILKPSSTVSFNGNYSGRLELANWLTSPEHPLTSRVMVNRVWAHLMGNGIVASLDNFGVSGSAPTHPELLDYLATQFMKNGWSVKSLIRSIALSRTYRLSGQHNPANAAIDEGNQLYWRSNLRRLEAESIRDSLLAAGDLLQNERPTGAPFEKSSMADALKGGKRGGAIDKIAEPVRSVYLPVYRSRLPGMFTVFDFAEPDQVNGQRDVTTVAPQALFMLNNPFVVDVSQRAADRILEQTVSNEEARVRYAYAYTLCRYPTPEETKRALAFVESNSDRRAGWATFTQAIYSSAEFRYIP